MRIGIDIRHLARQSADSAPEYGGVPHYTRQLLPILFDEGREHSFHLLWNSFQTPDLPILREWSNFANVQHYCFRWPSKLLTSLHRWAGRPYCDKLLGGADIFFSPHFLPAPVSSACKRAVVVHDLSFERYPEFLSFPRLLWHDFMNPRKQAEEADIVITPSFSTKQDLQELYDINEEKIKVIYPGVTPSTPPADKIAAPTDYILTLSVLEPRKNILGLIRAFEILKKGNKWHNLKLVIAGPRGWLWRDILRAARFSSASENIIIYGAVSERTKAALYRGARLFVYPSFYEGFGFPPLEAMSFGVPALVSDNTSLPEVVEEGALLINPHRPEEMAFAMGEVLSNEQLARALSAKGREQAAKFSWSGCARKILNVFEGF